jgi:hypothetical protein
MGEDGTTFLKNAAGVEKIQRRKAGGRKRE